MTWILQHLHYVHNYRRRKGRRRRGFGPSLDFATWYFPIIFVAKKIVYLVSSWKNEISPFLPTLRKSLASPGKFYYCPLPVHNVWLIMDNWWTTVIWSGSTKLCNRFRKHFGDLRWNISLACTSKVWLTWKFLVQLWELGGQLLPLPPPWLRAWRIGVREGILPGVR